MKCKFFKEISIVVNCLTDDKHKEKFRICTNPVCLVRRRGGVLFKDCNYSEKDESECFWKNAY